MNKFWKTQSGERIAYEDLEDRHLLNILKFLERKSENGVEVVDMSTVYAADKCEISFDPLDCHTILYGEDVLRKTPYYDLLHEATIRKLTTQTV